MPHADDATDRQRRDGMCWKDADELYNDGSAFKITCRDDRGVIVTIIADNYYGYCKKEVKTQISYAANLFGLCEEEHAGGAIAFPAYVLGQDFYAGRTELTKQVVYEDALRLLGRSRRAAARRVCRRPSLSGYLLRPGERGFPRAQGPRHLAVSGRYRSELLLRAGETYVLPWGTKIRLEKQPGGSAWRLIGVAADGVRSATSRARSPAAASPRFQSRIANIILKGPVFVATSTTTWSRSTTF